MCKNCLYRKNCQYLVKHNPSMIGSCTAFVSEQELKSEVAREIFEEIEKVILDNTYPDFDSKHKPVNVWKATTGYDAFYELKKKYTEGET